MPTIPRDDIKTTIEADGLRYKSKTPGSPFAGHGAFAAGTMSCFRCGRHRPRAVLKSKRILNRNEMVCSPSCQAVSDQLAAGNRVGAPSVPGQDSDQGPIAKSADGESAQAVGTIQIENPDRSDPSLRSRL